MNTESPQKEARKKGESTVLWWIGWIVLTIVSFFVSCSFWTRFIAAHVGSMQKPGVPILWVIAVFGSWLVLLIPLIVVMYQKVDKAYEDTRIARETAAFDKARKSFKVRSIHIEESKRQLKKELSQKLKKIPETIRHGHLVTAALQDGRKIENVFILNRKDMLGVYGAQTLTFDAGQIVDVEPADTQHLPAFHAEEWLRLDGVGGEA